MPIDHVRQNGEIFEKLSGDIKKEEDFLYQDDTKKDVFCIFFSGLPTLTGTNGTVPYRQ